LDCKHCDKSSTAACALRAWATGFPLILKIPPKNGTPGTSHPLRFIIAPQFRAKGGQFKKCCVATPPPPRKRVLSVEQNRPQMYDKANKLTIPLDLKKSLLTFHIEGAALSKKKLVANPGQQCPAKLTQIANPPHHGLEP